MNVFRRLFLSTLLLGLLGVSPLHADTRKGADTPQMTLVPSQGSEVFRSYVLDKIGLEPLGDMKALKDDPQNKLLIVFGDLSVLQDVPRRVGGFLRYGGAVLIATDRSTPHFTVGDFAFQIRGSDIVVPTDSPSAYRGRPDCIFVAPTEAGSPIFKNLKLVATNRPGYLQVDELKVFGVFPSDAAFTRQLPPDPLPFAAGAEIGRGRLLVLSDHSVFINGMLWQTDNDNIFFVRNCIDWLTEGKRRQVLFCEEGQIQSDLQAPLYNLPPPPLPPVEAVISAVNEGLRGLEEEDRFDEILRRVLQGMTPGAWPRVILLFLTLSLAVFGLSRLSLVRQRPEPGAKLVSSLPSDSASAASVLEERQQVMIQEENFWEPARLLARHTLETALNGTAPARNGAAARSVRPSVRTQGGWWNRWRLRRQAYWLWQLAYSPEPQRITSRRLARLRAELDAVKTALANGSLQIVESSHPLEIHSHG
jgi:hypothetical protein